MAKVNDPKFNALFTTAFWTILGGLVIGGFAESLSDGSGPRWFVFGASGIFLFLLFKD